MHEFCEGPQLDAISQAALMFAVKGARRAAAFALPGMRALWTIWRGIFESGFAAFMDKIMDETPMTQGSVRRLEGGGRGAESGDPARAGFRALRNCAIIYSDPETSGEGWLIWTRS